MLGGKKHKHTTTLLLAFVIPYYMSMSSWFRPLHHGKCVLRKPSKEERCLLFIFMWVDVSNGLSSVEQETILHFVEQESSLDQHCADSRSSIASARHIISLCLMSPVDIVWDTVENCLKWGALQASELREVRVGLGGRRAAALCSVRKL